MSRLREKFVGAIVGCGVGDALGAPFEGRRPSDIKLEPTENIRFSKIPIYPIGQYTDDTQFTLAIMQAILDTGMVDGAQIARQFVRLWQTGEIVGAGASCTEAVYNMLERGTDWKNAGTAMGRAGNGTAMRAAPIGLWNFARAADIRRDAEISSIITHKDTRSIAGTVAIAEAVALSVNSGTVEPSEFLGHISACVEKVNQQFSRCIDELVQWLPLEPSEALPRLYSSGDPEMGPMRPGWVTPYVIPTVLCAFYFFLRSPDNFLESVTGAIKAGGDTDTTGAITGAISGALNGILSIPPGLVNTLKDSAKIIALTDRFYQATVSRR